MKKKLLTLIALIMSVFMMATTMTACNLITTDSERDMNQVIATVSIEEGVSDNIYKKDLMLAYLNYGYSYQQQGYTQAQTVNAIITSLVESKVIVQHAMSEFDKGVAPFDKVYKNAENGNKWDITRYLTEEDLVDATYNTRKAMENLLTSYEEQDETKKDTLIETVRTVPTNAQNKVDELDLTAKKEYNAKKFENEFDRKAFVSTVKLLEANNLKGNAYDGTLESTDYYKQLLLSYREDVIVNRYSEAFIADVLSKATYKEIEDAYLAKITEQEQWSNAEFVSALSSASSSSPILYSAFGGYGYVYNLLLGASETQTEDIGKIKEDTPNISNVDYEIARKNILASTVIKDLRSSWILSGYDFEFKPAEEGGKIGTGVFTGDYAFTTKDNSLAFSGEVELIKDKTDTASAEYKINSITEYTLDAFVAMMDNYLTGSDLTKKVGSAYTGTHVNSVYGGNMYALNDIVEYNEKINELLFAFSTDGGSLNTFKGYAIAPKVDGANSEQYVETFAEAGRALLETGKNGYVIMASDFGYHVMFYSHKFNVKEVAAATLTEYLKLTEDSAKDWTAEFAKMTGAWSDYEDTDSYLYVLANEIVAGRASKALTEERTKIVNLHRYEERADGTKGVTIYEDTFANLLAE